MRAFVRVVSMLGGAACLAAGPAFADEAANEAAVAHLEAGTLAAGEAELASVLEADPANDDARMGLGTIRFVKAIETLSQGLYRYGLQPPQSMMMPIVRLPVPLNPNPEPVSYADFHDLLATFVADVGEAEKTLDGVGEPAFMNLPSSHWAYDAEVAKLYPHDPDKARALQARGLLEGREEGALLGVEVGVERIREFLQRGGRVGPVAVGGELLGAGEDAVTVAVVVGHEFGNGIHRSLLSGGCSEFSAGGDKRH